MNRYPSINADPDGRIYEQSSNDLYDRSGSPEEAYSPHDRKLPPPLPPYQATQQHQHYYPQPHFQPPVQPPQVYMASVPLAALNMGPAPVDCPLCGVRAITRIDYESGNQTHLWALIVCLFTCLGCIPYLLDGTKDVVHRCGHCGAVLAKWHRGGNTEVLAHPMMTYPMPSLQGRPPM